MTDIDQAINIGPVLADELRQAGIPTLEALCELGYLEAWKRLRVTNPERDCVNSALALAGATKGVRWMALSEAEKRQVTNAVGAIKLEETTRRRRA